MTVSPAKTLVVFLILCMNCGHVSAQEQENTGDQADASEQIESPKMDEGQSPTPESLISTFRKWHQADQLNDAAERDKMMGLIYVNRVDVETIFKDQAHRLQTTIDLEIELEKLRNVGRSERLKIKTIEAVDVREIVLNPKTTAPEARFLKSVSELFPENTPVYLLRIRWEKPMGGQGMGPFFFMDNRWTYVPDPGDMFEAAIKNISQEEIERHEKSQRRWIEQAKEWAANKAK